MQQKGDCEQFHRRDILRIGSAGLLGLTLPQLLKLEAQTKERKTSSSRPKAKSVIMIWLAGGPATIDMWDLKPGAPDGIRGEFHPIPTSANGVFISQHLSKIAEVMDKATLVRSLAHSIPSHGPASVFMTTGNKPTPAIQYPALGSLATRMLGQEPGVPPFVSFNEIRNPSGTPAGYLGTAYNPFVVDGVSAGKGDKGSLRVRGVQLPNDFTLEQLENRDQLLGQFDQTFRKLDRSANVVDGLDTFHRQALEILRSDKTKKAFQLDQEPEVLRSRYGNTPFGLGVLAARRLVEAGVRFVTISLGGWDTHGQNFQNLSTKLLPQLDMVLSSLIMDLSSRGLLDSTIVYCAGEFGRTPKINKNSGRDHWARSMAVFMAGGGLTKGQAFGTTDKEGMAPSSDSCSPDDLSATIFHLLGIDPHHELQTNTGRPMQLFRDGKIIEKILA